MNMDEANNWATQVSASLVYFQQGLCWMIESNILSFDIKVHVLKNEVPGYLLQKHKKVHITITRGGKKVKLDIIFLSS